MGEHTAIKGAIAYLAEIDLNERERAALKDLEKEIERGWTEIERLSKRLSHAHDAANGLYHAAAVVANDPAAHSPNIDALAAAISPAHLEAAAHEAARRDGLDARCKALEAEIERLKGERAQATDASRPGLSEEQIKTLIGIVRGQRAFEGDGDLLRALRAKLASRGEVPEEVRAVPSEAETLTREEAEARLRAHALPEATTAHLLDNARAIVRIDETLFPQLGESRTPDILRAYVRHLDRAKSTNAENAAAIRKAALAPIGAPRKPLNGGAK